MSIFYEINTTPNATQILLLDSIVCTTPTTPNRLRNSRAQSTPYVNPILAISKLDRDVKGCAKGMSQTQTP